MKRIALTIIAVILTITPCYAATYYVDNANGNDGSAGTSEGTAWATLTKAADTVAPGDSVYVQSGTEYTTEDSAANMVLTTDGTTGNPISFIGYTSTITDGGKAVINASGFNYGLNCNGIDYLIFENFEIKNASFDAILAGGNYCTYRRLDISNVGRYGINNGSYNTIFDCTFTGCGDDAIYVSNYTVIGGCIFHNTSASAIDCNGVALSVTNSRFSNPAASTTVIDAATHAIQIANCSFDGNGGNGTGIRVSGSNIFSILIYNNIFYDLNVAVSLTTNIGRGSILDNNYYYSNDTNDVVNCIKGYNAVNGSASPYTSEATQDYTLNDTAGGGAACKAAGKDAGLYMDIGGLQVEATGGGSGGFLAANKRGNKQ